MRFGTNLRSPAAAVALATLLSACGSNDSGLLTSTARDLTEQTVSTTTTDTAPVTATDEADATAPAATPDPAQSQTSESQFSANPALAGGLVLHLEADSGVSASGNQVTDWEDQSPAKNSVTSVGAPMLIEGELLEPVIAFNGIDSQLVRETDLQLPEGNSDRTVMLLVDYDEGEGGVSYGTPQCNSAFQAIINNNGFGAVHGWCGSNNANTNSEVADQGWVVQTAILKGSHLQQYLNGQLVDAREHSFSTVASELVIGGKVSNLSFAKMRVAAVLIWNVALDPAEFVSALNYLEDKYLREPVVALPERASPTIPPVAQLPVNRVGDGVVGGDIIDPIRPQPVPNRGTDTEPEPSFGQAPSTPEPAQPPVAAPPAPAQPAPVQPAPVRPAPEQPGQPPAEPVPAPAQPAPVVPPVEPTPPSVEQPQPPVAPAPPPAQSPVEPAPPPVTPPPPPVQSPVAPAQPPVAPAPPPAQPPVEPAPPAPAEPAPPPAETPVEPTPPPALPPAEPTPPPATPEPPAEPPVQSASVRMWTTNTNEGVIQLNWEASNAETCEASGAWRGAKSTSGLQRFTGRDIGDTFHLSCSGTGGNALGMVTVINKGLRMTWQAPPDTPEGDVTYGIHYGTESGVYTNTVSVDSQRASQLINVIKGPLHLAMTTTNAAGETSDYSNELAITVD